MTFSEALLYYGKRLLPPIDPAEADAMIKLLFEHVFQKDRTEFHALQRRILQEAELTRLTQLTDRLIAGEPVQYVTGEAWFCGLKLMVNNQVLIPRPETEELVEWIIANCRFPVSALDILDIGTGSGCLALALKRRIRKATVTAADVDPGALSVARHNAHHLAIDITILQTDLLDPATWNVLPVADIIVCNPPYISAAEKTAMSATVLDHEPHRALFAPEADPLIFYRQLAILAENGLQSEGQLFCELNASLAQQTAAIFQEAGFQVMLKEDMQGNIRLLRAWR